jgi:hypothetical protein
MRIGNALELWRATAGATANRGRNGLELGDHGPFYVACRADETGRKDKKASLPSRGIVIAEGEGFTRAKSNGAKDKEMSERRDGSWA